ncbi:unnamed protein product [Brassica oleracea]
MQDILLNIGLILTIVCAAGNGKSQSMYLNVCCHI